MQSSIDKQDRVAAPRANDGLAPEGRILLVDDDEALLRVQARLLRGAGFDVNTAPSGPRALQLCEDSSFDLVISDVAMPGMDGTEVLKRLRSQAPDLPVLLVTGQPSLDSAIAAVEHRALQYLRKPLSSEDLLAAARKAVGLGRIARLERQALAANAPPPPEPVAAARCRFERGLGELWLAAQPIISLVRRRTIAFEVLLRTREKSIPHPGAFLTLAERVGEEETLARHIRHRAAGLIGGLGEDQLLFVNLRPEDLLDDELYQRDAPLTAVAGRVVLEITERAPLDCVSDMAERMLRLKRLGFRIAVDDLGAGYAGLSALAQLDPDIAKIDMSLVRDVDRDPRRSAIIEGLIDTCTRLGLQLVAEGVETDMERDSLANLGCDLMQGYRFARPQEVPPAVEPGAFGGASS